MGEPQLDVDALVSFKLFLDILKVEVKGGRLPHVAWRCELLGQREEFMVVAAVVEEFYDV